VGGEEMVALKIAIIDDDDDDDDDDDGGGGGGGDVVCLVRYKRERNTLFKTGRKAGTYLIRGDLTLLCPMATLTHNRFEATSDLKSFFIRAIRDIEEGEEITLSYGDVRSSSFHRVYITPPFIPRNSTMV